MKSIKLISFLFTISLFFSCQKPTEEELFQTPSTGGVSPCEKKAIDNGWVFKTDQKTWLYGGVDNSSHFDISNWGLNVCQLKSGLGREFFKALISPQYVSLTVYEDLFQDSAKFIVVEQEDGLPKVYPIDLMIKHEVINEVINGQPVMIAYCVLADLGAVYSRIYCDEELTFALSGFTYHDEAIWGGLDAFVLWDRETESLWWPLIDRAISGGMQNTTLKKYDGGWLDLTFGEIKNTYGLENVLVLEYNQTMEIPENWPRLNEVDCQ